jgi:hypothetical protein
MRVRFYGGRPVTNDSMSRPQHSAQNASTPKTDHPARTTQCLDRAHQHRLDVRGYLHKGPGEDSLHSASRGHYEPQWRDPRRPRAINGGNERVSEAHDFEAMRQAWVVDAVRLGGSVEAAPVTCMGVCVCTHGGTWVGTLPLRRGSAALGGARRVERSGPYYLPYQGGDPA